MRQHAGNEVPFAYHIGRVRMGKSQPGRGQGSAYGKWDELGVPRERVFNMDYTVPPWDYTGTSEEGHIDPNKWPCHLAGESTDHNVFARAIKPHHVEICTAVSKDMARQGE